MNLVINYFEKAASIYGNKTAVIYEDISITYNQLLEKAKALGTYLNIQNNEPVIVFMDKSPEALSCFLGILYAGGCYSLINTDLPESRITHIKDTLNSKVIITSDEYYEKALSLFAGLQVINIDKEEFTAIDELKLKQIMEQKIDLDPVYINFTSGSTGVPKGVAINNRSIIDFINIFTEEFGFNEQDIIANQAPLDFDVSVKDIYSAWFKGATIVLIPKAYFSSPAKLLDYLVDNKVTTMTWAVSALCLITTFHGLDYKVPSTVNKIIFSGEVMPLKHLNIWMDKLPHTKFINVYGPTEITCNCTYHIIDRQREYLDAIPIGKAFKNERVFLLDDNNKLVTDIHKPGEICVSGSCLALGYYNNKEQTNNHFCQNPINTVYNEMIYRTGDLAEYNDLGELIFKGRKDFQIKYMGHRIELEEIDKNILKHDGVINSCTIFDDKKSRLYNFYIGDIDKKELHAYLKEVLPIYMVPNTFFKLEAFPLNKNGKIDRKELLKIKEELK